MRRSMTVSRETGDRIPLSSGFGRDEYLITGNAAVGIGCSRA